MAYLSVVIVYGNVFYYDYIVPVNRVFECSDFIWGMICKQSEKVTLIIILYFCTIISKIHDV